MFFDDGGRDIDTGRERREGGTERGESGRMTRRTCVIANWGTIISFLFSTGGHHDLLGIGDTTCGHYGIAGGSAPAPLAAPLAAPPAPSQDPGIILPPRGVKGGGTETSGPRVPEANGAGALGASHGVPPQPSAAAPRTAIAPAAGGAPSAGGGTGGDTFGAASRVGGGQGPRESATGGVSWGQDVVEGGQDVVEGGGQTRGQADSASSSAPQDSASPAPPAMLMSSMESEAFGEDMALDSEGEGVGEGRDVGASPPAARGPSANVKSTAVLGTPSMAPANLRRSPHAPGAQSLVPPPRSPRSVRPACGGGAMDLSLKSPRAGSMDAQRGGGEESDNLLAGKAFGLGNVPGPRSPRGGALGGGGGAGGQMLAHEELPYAAFCSSALHQLGARASSEEGAGAGMAQVAPSASAPSASPVVSPRVSNGISAVSHGPREPCQPPVHSSVQHSGIDFSRRNEDGGRARSGFSICGLV